MLIFSEKRICVLTSARSKFVEVFISKYTCKIPFIILKNYYLSRLQINAIRFLYYNNNTRYLRLLLSNRVPWDEWDISIKHIFKINKNYKITNSFSRARFCITYNFRKNRYRHFCDRPDTQIGCFKYIDYN